MIDPQEVNDQLIFPVLSLMLGRLLQISRAARILTTYLTSQAARTFCVCAAFS
jgi:hypothetical protein